MDDNDVQTPLIDEEITEIAVSDDAASSSAQPLSQAELIVSLTGLINSNLKEIESLEQEMSKQKEMIDSVLANDATYKEHEEKAKEASKIKTNTKKEIFKREDVKHVVAKLTELKENIADTREELSNYIQEYATASGQNYFEAEDGTIQEIVYIAKLRKKQA